MGGRRRRTAGPKSAPLRRIEPTPGGQARQTPLNKVSVCLHLGSTMLGHSTLLSVQHGEEQRASSLFFVPPCSFRRQNCRPDGGWTMGLRMGTGQWPVHAAERVQRRKKNCWTCCAALRCRCAKGSRLLFCLVHFILIRELGRSAYGCKIFVGSHPEARSSRSVLRILLWEATGGLNPRRMDSLMKTSTSGTEYAVGR